MTSVNAVSTRREILELKHLPPLSLTAARLLEAVADPDVEVEAIADIISQDPGLAARIIGLANSAFFGQVQPITSVKDAIIRVLGLNTVKNLSLSIAVSGVFQTGQCRGFDLKDYWFTAIACATLARTLALHMPLEERPDPDAVYLGGLLHNLGYLILAHAFPSKLSLALKRMREESTDPVVLQQELIGIDWISAGVWLARRWHLPETVVRMIEGVGREQPRTPDLYEAVLVGSSSHWLQDRAGSEDGVLHDQEALRTLPGLDQDSLAQIQNGFEEQVEELNALSRELA